MPGDLWDEEVHVRRGCWVSSAVVTLLALLSHPTFGQEADPKKDEGKKEEDKKGGARPVGV